MPAQSIPGCRFGANLVILAQIWVKLLFEQGKVYGLTDGQTGGRRQRQYPFGPKCQRGDKNVSLPLNEIGEAHSRTCRLNYFEIYLSQCFIPHSQSNKKDSWYFLNKLIRHLNRNITRNYPWNFLRNFLQNFTWHFLKHLICDFIQYHDIPFIFREKVLHN